MHRIALALLLALPGLAAADATTQVAPVFGQVVLFPLPDGFVPAWEQANADGYVNESVPQGETVEAWSQMVTLTGSRGLWGADPRAIVESVAAGYAAACPGSFASDELGAPAVPGARATAAAWLACGDAGGRSEAMVILVMTGAQDAYTLQWAARGPAGGRPGYDAAAWDARLALLAGTARLCEPEAGEGPPYPSCTD